MLSTLATLEFRIRESGDIRSKWLYAKAEAQGQSPKASRRCREKAKPQPHSRWEG